MILTSGIEGVKGDGMREEKNVAGCYGDVMTQATLLQQCVCRGLRKQMQNEVVG